MMTEKNKKQIKVIMEIKLDILEHWIKKKV